MFSVKSTHVVDPNRRLVGARFMFAHCFVLNLHSFNVVPENPLVYVEIEDEILHFLSNIFTANKLASKISGQYVLLDHFHWSMWIVVCVQLVLLSPN